MKTTNTPEEQTLALLKPSPALRRLGPIRSRFATCGHIVEARMVQLNQDAVDVLTEHLNYRPAIKFATEKHLLGQTVPIFVIQGENIIERISRLVGISVNPEFCTEDSIRHQMWEEFGCRAEHLQGGSTYFNNFLHCTRNKIEANRHIAALINPNLVSFRF
jgi:nucleoside diphosphate kinase